MTTINDLLNIPNSQTGGWFWLAMLFLVFLVFVMTFLVNGLEIALLSGGFITLILGLFLVYLNLVSWKWLMFFLGIILATLFYITWNNRKDYV